MVAMVAADAACSSVGSPRRGCARMASAAFAPKKMVHCCIAAARIDTPHKSMCSGIVIEAESTARNFLNNVCVLALR